MSSSRTETTLAPFWAELARVERLARIDRALRAAGWEVVAGVDEAGRGSFAGPVVAAAVVLPADAPLLELDDSKRIDAACRARVRGRLERIGARVAVGIVGPEEIDGDDILSATRRAMTMALDRLGPVDLVVTDAVTLSGITAPVVPLVRADARVAAVAAASVVAKVVRDGLMERWHDVYPWYGFRDNRGYGTEEHRAALGRHGPSPIHRLTFGGVIPVRAAA